jgi:predicted nucleotidyltransferase
MGTRVKHINRSKKSKPVAAAKSSVRVPMIPWLDPETAADVVDITQSVAEQHPEAQAVILFGSVARREERPLDDPEPSDVDILVLVDPKLYDPTSERLTQELQLALFHTIGEADYRHRLAPREIQTLVVQHDLKDWDPMFIENVARDGVLLWARSPDSLPSQWTMVGSRDLDALLSSRS